MLLNYSALRIVNADMHTDSILARLVSCYTNRLHTWLVAKEMSMSVRPDFGRILILSAIFILLPACVTKLQPTHYDVIIRGGTIYDGSGDAPFIADVAIDNERIMAVGDLSASEASQVVQAGGLAVSPGFVNMLSWANGSLIKDGRGVSDLLQGVTLEVFGEGWTMGPWNEAQKKAFEIEAQMEQVPWATLGEYLEFLEDKGISPNVASFVGAETLRVNVIGYEDRPPTAGELARMQELVRLSMREGALGVGSALIYTPGSYASTSELIELARVAGEYGGIYASHVRSLGERLLDGIGELMIIARKAEVDAHVYHLIAAGKANWNKLDNAIALIDGARQSGLNITSDMHPYTMAGTNLNITTPPWARDGGSEAFVRRLLDPDERNKIKAEMLNAEADWENAYLWAGPEGIVLAEISEPEIKEYEGKTIIEIAAMMGKSPEDTVLDLLIAGGGNAGAMYHIYSEENIRKKTAVPWIAFMSDSPTSSGEGEDINQKVHPRGYGTFARVLGKYARDENTLTLAEAVRRLSAYPAGLLKIRERGQLRQGYYADIAIFNPDEIQDHATVENPHQLATGVIHVFVNGKQVVEDGEHTGELPGQIARGPGWAGWQD